MIKKQLHIAGHESFCGKLAFPFVRFLQTSSRSLDFKHKSCVSLSKQRFSKVYIKIFASEDSS